MADQQRRPGGGARRTGAGSAQRQSGGQRRENTRRQSSGQSRGARSTPRKSSQQRPRTKPDSAANYPPVPDNAGMPALDREVRAELRSLSKPNAEAVAHHLVAAGELVDTDPERALAHARAARARAGRVAAVREAVGVAAYHAENWAEALTELRTARRISGDPHNLPLLADCERALGRPAAALRYLNDPDVSKLDRLTRTELLIVVAGARRDLGQLEAALAVLARGGLDRSKPRPGAARLWYAYADTLEAAGRRDEAANWFAAAAEQDVDDELDAAERAARLL